jgi:hypothetical protein
MQDGPASRIPSAWISNVFGQPARACHYGALTIMTWTVNPPGEIG